MIRVQSELFDPAVELAEVASLGAGAVVSFVGTVRGRSDSEAVTALVMDHYPGFTEKGIEAIADDARNRFALERLSIVHRYGELLPGEAIVFVAAAARHRRAAFDAVDFVMDRLKTDAAFWKKEHGPAGGRWIEARPADHADRARWNEDRDVIRD